MPRILTLASYVLAFVHLFPARKHLALFFDDPSWSEAWKGFGAVVAIALYLLPRRHQIHALSFVWRRRTAASLVGCLLVIVHLVPAADHLPAFLAHASFGDAWRGFGACIAVLWFVMPVRWQGWSLARAARRLTPSTSS